MINTDVTVPAINWGEALRAYVLNTEPSEDGLAAVAPLRQALADKFGEDALLGPDNGIHITLMDWVAPRVDYGRDKDELFAEIFPKFDAGLSAVLSNQKPIAVRFNEIWVTPDAVIVVGTDDGSYQTIRDGFLAQVELVPGTKLPPKIIHSTLTRFAKSIPLDEIREVVKNFPIDFVQVVDHFRLIKEFAIPMLEFEEIKRYSF